MENNNYRKHYNTGSYLEPLFSSLFDYPFTREENHVLKTDVRENEESFELDVEVPGIKKEDTSLSLEDGYLTINVISRHNNEEKDKKGRIIRQERSYGTYKRSYYVGEEVTQEDISASMNDGILKIEVKKAQKQIPVKTSIEIK